ncbi:MAG: D-2-hydroxyacid dehydrogenase [Planctomycetota bacterium]|nr:MAG: D-2-hydroxyacid dehydrogenase [Planctomycetota bacterium]
MNIIVTDGGTLNPGDLSWDELKTLGQCDVYDATAPEQVLDRCKDAEVIITNKVVLDRQVIASLPKLKYIGVTATGYNVVDVAAAREKNIPVANVPIYGTQSVAQMVFAHLLELTQHVGYHSGTVHEGRWAACPDFCYWDRPLIELEGLTMGVVGYGRIGQAAAKLARAFGMNVIAYDIYADKMADLDVQFVELDELFAKSDVITLHCPLTPENEGLANAQRLSLMKKSAFLINTSRGQLINEQDLADALNSEQIAGAGLDVLYSEPPSPDNPLLQARNCYITPHIAWATRSARQRLLTTSIENVKAYQAGSPINVVN